jgi:hypothetical protein
MKETISYCGLNCQGCPIHLATREKDREKQYKMRVEIAQQIKEHYGQEYKPEDISDCDGCKANSGRLFSGSHNCYMRKCARQKNFENCAYCDDYPCEELEKFFTTDQDARKRLDAIKSTL